MLAKSPPPDPPETATALAVVDGVLVRTMSDGVGPEAEELIGWHGDPERGGGFFNRLAIGLLKSQCVRSGVARLMVLGDWLIERDEEMVREGLATVALSELEMMLAKFYRDHGIELAQGDKFIHLDVGCGNGQLPASMRLPKDERTRQWAEFGFADRIYYTMESLVRSLLRPEYANDPGLLEFIKTVSVLISRQIQAASAFAEQSPSTVHEWLMQGIETQPNLLRPVLQDLELYLGEHFRTMRDIAVDGEFLEDGRAFLSDGCLAKRDEYFELGSERFWSKYLDLCPEVNLNEQVSIFPRNIILGDFANIGQIFPEVPLFNLTHSRRGSSHAPDSSYFQLNLALARRLKPGGMIVDEGVAESYTRFRRLDEITMLREALKWPEGEYRVGVIANKNGARTLCVERGIPTNNGYAFFTDQNSEQFVQDGFAYLRLESHLAELTPEHRFSNEVTAAVRMVFSERIASELGEEPDAASVINRVRGQFRGIHEKIRVALERAFGQADWARIRELAPREKEYRDFTRSCVLQDVLGS